MWTPCVICSTEAQQTPPCVSGRWRRSSLPPQVRLLGAAALAYWQAGGSGSLCAEWACFGLQALAGPSAGQKKDSNCIMVGPGAGLLSPEWQAAGLEAVYVKRKRTVCAETEVLVFGWTSIQTHWHHNGCRIENVSKYPCSYLATFMMAYVLKPNKVENCIRTPTTIFSNS